MFDTWTLTVFCVMNSASAIRRLVRPSATRASTARSRLVSSGNGASAAAAMPGSAICARRTCTQARSDVNGASSSPISGAARPRELV
jgi:hypothetical protein